MNRRGFLTRSGLALGALVLGDDALEAFARLTHVRKSFPSAAVPTPYRYAVRVGLPPVTWRLTGYGEPIGEMLQRRNRLLMDMEWVEG